MDQVGEWNRSTPVPAARAGGEPKPASFVSQAPLPAAAVKPTVAARPAPSRPAPSAATPTPGDEVIEVPAEELGLAELAELARKVVEKKP
jgi:hypothetical protein